MTTDHDVVSDDAPRIVRAEREVDAPAEVIFELIADPAKQPRWDGNGNLARATEGQRVHGVGDVFTMTNTSGKVRENHVVEFAEGELIAWQPAEPGGPPFGQLWRWELAPLGAGRTRVTHSYDWTAIAGTEREERARWTTSERLLASIDRLAELAERTGETPGR